jgi:hypothetical protein
VALGIVIHHDFLSGTTNIPKSMLFCRFCNVMFYQWTRRAVLWPRARAAAAGGGAASGARQRAFKAPLRASSKVVVAGGCFGGTARFCKAARRLKGGSVLAKGEAKVYMCYGGKPGA